MSALTRKQKKAYIGDVQRIGRKCPFCGSYDVEGVERAEIGGLWMHKEVECSSCGEDWCEIYKLVDIEKELDED